MSHVAQASQILCVAEDALELMEDINKRDTSKKLLVPLKR